MSSVAGILVGLVLLGYGRRLYWAFVAGVGFLTGLALGSRLLPGQPEWMILTVALVLALAGGGIGLLLLRQQGITGDVPAWVVYLVAGIVGLVLVRTLFEWALIVLSSLAGAGLIGAGVEGRIVLSQGLACLLVIAVALIGIAVQAGLRGQPPRRGAPGRGA
ncbi:MAG TPA: hypothetical protein VGV06_05055 [Methylomirabilota bacterium]|nr:hypothetical protein [Methylomirabilota bacterium]